MIEKINPQTSYKWMEHKQLIDKINELVEQVNKLTTHLKGHLETHQYIFTDEDKK